jgi:hypothetical protein
MERVIVKGHEKEIAKLIPMLLKKGVDDVILSREVEIKLLEDNLKLLEKEFRLEIEVMGEDNGKALPFKPAIFVE